MCHELHPDPKTSDPKPIGRIPTDSTWCHLDIRHARHHDAIVRTTVTLDRDVEQRLRETALRTRRPFKRVLNEALRSALDAQEPLTAGRFEVKSRPMGLRAGLDPTGFNRLADDLEAEAFLEATRKLQAASR